MSDQVVGYQNLTFQQDCKTSTYFKTYDFVCSLKTDTFIPQRRFTLTSKHIVVLLQSQEQKKIILKIKFYNTNDKDVFKTCIIQGVKLTKHFSFLVSSFYGHSSVKLFYLIGFLQEKTFSLVLSKVMCNDQKSNMSADQADKNVHLRDYCNTFISNFCQFNLMKVVNRN